jgi:hypothetical protein
MIVYHGLLKITIQLDEGELMNIQKRFGNVSAYRTANSRQQSSAARTIVWFAVSNTDPPHITKPNPANMATIAKINDHVARDRVSC